MGAPQKYMNKKLVAAIKDGKPLRWEFGKYAKWYTGLKLVAYTGYAETGRIYETVVFATTSKTGFKEMCATLDAHGIKHDGQEEALRQWERQHSKRKSS